MDKEKAKEYIDIEIHKKKDLLKQFEKKSDKSEEKDIFKELDSRARNVKKEDLEEFKKQIRPILDQVYVHAEHIIGIENVETMLSELKAVHNVLENI